MAPQGLIPWSRSSLRRTSRQLPHWALLTCPSLAKLESSAGYNTEFARHARIPTTSHSFPIGTMNADCASSRLLMSLSAAHRWLQSAFSNTRPLLRSYEGGGVCYTYDQAIGVCAFVALGEFDSAHRLLLALSSLQLASGGFYTAYWENGAPQEYNQHVGPVLWVALAAFLYERYSGSKEFRSLGTQSLYSP